MKEIITREIEKLKSELEKFFEEDNVSLDKAEPYFTEKISEAVRCLLTACYEKKDAELLANKALRKEVGLVVERRGDIRQIVTQLGEVNAAKKKRTAEKVRNTLGLSHPDMVVSIPVKYQKITPIARCLINICK